MLASAPALSTLKPRNGPNHTLHTGTQNFRLETGTRLPWAWIFYISKKPILHKEIKPILLLFIVYSIYIVFAVYPEAGLGHPGLHPRHLHPLLPAVRQVGPDHGDMMIMCVVQRGDRQHRARGVRRGVRPLGHRRGEGRGEVSRDDWRP